jgi:LCP family protein required for cell wall assembly
MVVLVAVLLVAVGAGYGYFRYEWSQVSSAPCTTCVAAANGAPYNILVIGSDSRAGETSAQAQQFGSVQSTSGQRSDTIKIVHVDPQTGTASTLSIPRDTYVTLSGVPASYGLAAQNKINAAFSAGPDALIQTIENTFGIPISHYIVINFFGLEDAVNALGGIRMDVPYPVRDRDCSTGTCYNNSGLDLSTTGCQTLDGAQALSLSRSRYFEYEQGGEWYADGSGDIGRIERQNLIIEAAVDRAKATYDPIRLTSLLDSVVHDFSKDDALTPDDLLSLATRYHAFSGSDLQALTLPTTPVDGTAQGDVEVVEPDAAATMITQFLGGPMGTIVTPPVDGNGDDLTYPAVTTPTTPTTSATASAPVTSPSSAPASSGTTSSGTTPASSSIPAFDPRPC